MSTYDPFAAPNSKTLLGIENGGTLNHYSDGFFRPVQSFDFWRMVSAPFKSPNWAMNLLWMFVCELGAIVVIGRVVAFGYMAEVAEARSGGKSESWPDFVPERFNEYLMRGLWPFIWSVIWSIPMVLIVWVPGFLTISLANLLSQNGSQAPGAIVAIVGGAACVFVMLCFALAMLASMVHSALGNDFMKGADLKWVWSYLSKVGSTTAVACFLYGLVGMAASVAGFMFFCVGIFLVSPLMSLLAADLFAQLHDIFVYRGGVPAFAVPELGEEIIEAQLVL